MRGRKEAEVAFGRKEAASRDEFNGVCEARGRMHCIAAAVAGDVQECTAAAAAMLKYGQKCERSEVVRPGGVNTGRRKALQHK